MNAAYIALIGTLATVLGAVLSPIIMRALGREERRADVAAKYQTIAAGASDEVIALKLEMKNMRIAVERLVDDVELIVPCIEQEHRDVGDRLRASISEVRNTL